MLPSQIYSLSIPANGSVQLQVAGRMFKLISASGAVSFTGDTFGQLGQILAGQGLRDLDFGRLLLTDKSGAINNVSVLVAGTGFVDDRIFGETSVIDGGKAKTLTGSAYIGAGGVAAAGAGVYGYLQLFNVSATRRIVLSTLRLAVANTAGYVGLLGTSGQLGGQVGTGNSKLVMGGATSGQIRAGTGATDYVAGAVLPLYDNLYLPVGQVLTYQFKEPLVLTNYTGLTIQSAQNMSLNASFEFTDEAM